MKRGAVSGASLASGADALVGTSIVAASAPVYAQGARFANQQARYPEGDAPRLLFLRGEQGGWWDPSDRETLFQDAAGTVPVTTLGQPVGRILDKSDNGNHLVQTGDASRPTWQARSNLLLATTTLATQSVTTLAATYTLSFFGDGTITLSGTSTAGPLVGTGATDRVTLTFTATAGSLTLTVSGTVTDAQLELSATATTYQRVTTETDYEDIGLPRSLQFDGLDDFFLTEKAITVTGPYFLVAGVFINKNTEIQFVADIDPQSGTRIPQLLRFSTTNPQSIAFTSAGVFTDSGPPFSVGNRYLVSATADGPFLDVRLNRQSNGATATPGILNSNTRQLTIGRASVFSVSGNHLNGAIYGLILRLQSDFPVATAAAESWIVRKTGLVL
jgi:hypothetical protein